MRTFKLLSVLLIVSMLLAACGPKATPTPQPTTPAPTQAVQTPEATPKPTEAPTPEAPARREWPEGVAAILTVHLQEGKVWSDGTPVTAKDLVGTHNILWAQRSGAWAFLKDVVAVNDTTVEFWLTTPSPRANRLILRSYQPAPYSQYGAWMDKAADFRARGVANDSDEVKAFLDELYAFEPDSVVAYGPFILNPNTVTEAQLELVKNPTGHNADKIDLEKIIVYYGETAVSMPLVLSGDIDYSTHGYTPSDVEQFKTLPFLQVLSGPTGTGPGLWFNQDVYPLNKREVRQAFAHIIDREENATVAMGPAGRALKYMAGFTDLQVPAWLSPEVIKQLNPYETDLDKAAALLEAAGCVKQANGSWVDDRGNPLAFELSVPADFADWLGSAENAAQQLNAFGIKATVRGYPSSERAVTQREGKYQILIDLSLFYNPPHPQTSFNYYLNTPRNNPVGDAGQRGINWPWTQKGSNGQPVDILELLTNAAAGLTVEEQQPYVEELALILNRELPVLALFERYSTDPINTEARVTGWLPLSDPIYQNGQGADNYIAIQFLKGQLKKTANGDGTFRTVWPYPQPPNYVLNYFATSSLPQSVGTPSYNMMYPPLFWYYWADAEYVPELAKGYTLETPPEEEPEAALPEGVATILTVKLREGLKWSDGTPVTAKDLVGTHNILWAQRSGAWAFLKDVVAVNDTTVEFWLTTPSPRANRLILRSYQPAPYSQYGAWMDKAADFRARGVANDSDEVKAFLDELYAFEPDSVVAYGPFILNPNTVTEAQLELVKNPTGHNADKIDLEKIIVYYGETAVSMPLVLSGDIDYSTHGYTPSDVEQFKTLPFLQVLSGPTGTGPGLWFNQDVYPLNKREVRQAFAHIIDREENATVAMGPAGRALKYMAGFTDLQVPAWLSPEVIKQLNPYETDLDKAAALLEAAGCVKQANGSWVDDRGNPLAFELSVPADFADWLGSAENAAQQLNAFGIKATVRGYPSSERAVTQREGKYQILIDLSLFYNPPHPQTSFNYYLNTPRNNPVGDAGQRGINWPWTQKGSNGQPVDILELLTNAAAGLTVEEQQPYVEELALILNRELPVLALFERYSTDPINTEARVTGWLPLSDPIYQNGQGADNYIAIQFLKGQLKKTANGDGTFRTVWPYPQPPNYVLNYFATSSLPQSVGTPSYNMMYPPLFWYYWADAEYVPELAESYSFR